MKSIAQSIAAILAGIVINIVLSLALDALFRVIGVLPPGGQAMTDAQHALPFAYRVLIALLGFYVTARLAPRAPVAHAMVLAAIAFALTLANTLATWHQANAAQPQWFQVSMLVLLFPLAWIGARWATRSRPDALR